MKGDEEGEDEGRERGGGEDNDGGGDDVRVEPYKLLLSGLPNE